MYKKLLITLAAAAAVVVLFTGIMAISRKNNDQSDESSVVVSETQMIIIPSEMPERITLDIPPGFTETQSPQYDRYFVLDDASVIVTGEELSIYGQTVKTYGDSVKAQYESVADDFLLQSDELITVSGVECRVFEFAYAIKGAGEEQKMQCTTAVLIKDERVYIVTCKSHAETYQTHRQAFRRAIESVQIADEPPMTAPGTQTTAALAAETAAPLP